jgi:DNA-directed RNA polymerase subunit D
MKVNVLSSNDSEIKFIVEGVKHDFAGELRRIMLSEVPTMAIEWVDFIKNDSALPDEMLANRMGQIPLTFDSCAYNLPSECKCEGKGCSQCQVKISLKKKRPDMVYASDLKPNAKDVAPVFERIPIIELFEDQELELNAIAQLGLGKEHVKWQAAVVGYKSLPTVSVANLKDEKSAQVLESICPKHVFKVSDKKVVIADSSDCDMCIRCVDAVKSGEVKGEVKVLPIEDSFMFTVETTSGIKPDEIVSQAAGLLEKKMADFSKAVKKLK